MQTNSIAPLRSLTALGLASLLTGCYPTAGVKNSSNTYNEVCEKVADSGPAPVAAACAEDDENKPVVITAAVATARKCVNGKRANYARIYCEQEWSNKKFNYSLLGTALVAGGAALAKADANVLGGIGAIAGGISGLKAYQHPDTSRDASVSAYEQLTCVYDRSYLLNAGLVQKQLEYDRENLRHMIGEVTSDLADLTSDDRDSAAGKAAVKAAQESIAAGESALKQISTSLNDLANLPRLVYTTANSVDIAARKANNTSGSYDGFHTTIKDAYTAAAKDAVGKEDAAKKASSAQGAATASEAAVKAQKKKSSALEKLGGTSSTLDSALKAQDNKFIASIRISGFQDNPFITSIQNSDLPAQHVRRSTSSDTAKLASLAVIAVDDLPSPLYSAVAAEITGCAPKNK